MRQLWLFCALTLALTLGGPTATADPLLPRLSGGAPCNADRAQWAVGWYASPSVAERARRSAGARTVRVLGPDDITTMEFLADRLTLDTDSHRIIRQVRCG